MKNIFTLGLMAVAAVSTLSSSVPAFADHEDRAREDAHEARHEEHKAERDAARGDIAGAERHQQEARHDEHKARHQARKAGY